MSFGTLLMSILTVTWVVILVLIGVNMLIIVHEFGHFIVARMCGVRCDKFYIWFDIYGWRFFRFKWGDTEYGLGVLPLGGYVKMFGQEDNPGAIRAEMERAKLATVQDQARNLPSQEQLAQMEKSLYAKDSYLSKSVPQRMAIIVAGVVMNVIFAFICGIGAFLFGMDVMPPIVGITAPGSAAWKAGLQPGDKILAIDGRPMRLFEDITPAVIGSTAENVRLEVERSGISEPLVLYVAPKMEKHDLFAKLGLIPMNSLKLDKDEPVSKSIFPLDDKKILQGGETLIAVNGEKVADYVDLWKMESRLMDQPLKYTFERKGNDGKDGTAATIDLDIPAKQAHTLGFTFAMGPITALRPEAEKAGLVLGDLIQTIEGEPADPLSLARKVFQWAKQGKEQLSLAVKRGDETKTVNVPIVLDTVEKQLISEMMLGSSILGIAYEATSKIGFSETLPVGGMVTGLTVPDSAPKEIRQGNDSFGVPVEGGFRYTNEDRAIGFPLIVSRIIRLLPLGTSVTLHVKENDKIHDFPLIVAVNPEIFEVDRGLNFSPMKFRYRANSFGEAVQLGGQKTIQSLLAVYHFIRSMTYGQATGTSRVSAKGMGGPILIVRAAYLFASSGMGPYLIFLCLLGANLAVLNILPLPILDGGHLVFLTYEAIFRKPPNENVQIILSYIVLFLLLALMIWVSALDLGFIKRI